MIINQSSAVKGQFTGRLDTNEFKLKGISITALELHFPNMLSMIV
jgi:hypothetical protein